MTRGAGLHDTLIDEVNDLIKYFEEGREQGRRSDGIMPAVNLISKLGGDTRMPYRLDPLALSVYMMCLYIRHQERNSGKS